MTGVSETVEEFEKVEAKFAELVGTAGDEGLRCATPVELHAFGAKCYESLTSNLPSDSPHIYSAQQVVGSGKAALEQAEALFGIVRAARALVEDEGYAPGDEQEYFKSYELFSGVLRNWLIAFGVGGPAVLIAEPALFARLEVSGSLSLVFGAFLAGVGIQVLKALVYKAASWFAMDYDYKPESRLGFVARCSRWVGNDMSVDLSLDLVTIAAFGIAAYATISSLGPA